MISTNDLSIFLLRHNQNRVYDHNLRSIQGSMLSDRPYGYNFKRVCVDFPNPAILAKSATPGELQVVYVHASIGNKALGETVTAFALAGSLEAPTMVSIGAERAGAGENIHLLTTEFLLRAAASDLSKSKKLRYWAALNAILLPPFLAEAVVLKGETEAAEILKSFAAKILELGLGSSSAE